MNNIKSQTHMGNNKEENLNVDNIMVQDILNTFKDLREYSIDVEKQLLIARKESLGDHIHESKNIANLHKQISSCDDILERMENMLVTFQNDLGNISSEIVLLQRKSITMSLELNNRQCIRGQISQFIDDMMVPDTLITSIMDLPVTDKEFLSQLQLLNHKLSFVKEQSFKESASCDDVEDVLNNLKTKCMEKIREYLLEQIYRFRKPLANYQVPQNNMLKFKYCYEFTLANERKVAQEIYKEYVDTMSKIYFSYFKSYNNRLMKLQYDECITKEDLMGIEDTVNRSIFSKSFKKGTTFTIGNRGDVLAQQLEAPIIVPHSQTQIKNKFPYESLFRSEQYALVDNACREYLFVCEFFMLKGQQALEAFNAIMLKTTNLILKNVESYVDTCYDSIALFLCYHLVLRYRIMCHKRCVPALDFYWDTLEQNLLSRFEYVFNLNIQSIKSCDPAKFIAEMGPHYITRRYAEFSAALVGISESYPNELINRLLSELQEEVELFILKMAANFSKRKDQLIFLINNYDMILSIILEHTRDNSKEVETFKLRLSTKSGEYVEEILKPYFGNMMKYVKDAELMLQNGNITEYKALEDTSGPIVEHFTTTWKKSLEELSREVLISFPSLVTGSSLLQLSLTKLVQYYHRFHKLLPQASRSQLTNIHNIMVEMKKYKVNY